MENVFVLIPAYNAAKTLPGVIDRIPTDFRENVIVVDDGSSDTTGDVAASLESVRVLRHHVNQGYGGAQKTLYDAALSEGAEVMVMLHSDGGHAPEELPTVVGPVLGGNADVVVGSRMRGILGTIPARVSIRALRQGHSATMPDHVFLANLVLSRIQNRCYGTDLSSFHDGFRACTARVLEKIPFDSFGKGWIFDTEFLAAAANLGFSLDEVPVSTYYDPEVSAFGRNVKYGFAILRHAVAYALTNQGEARVRSRL